MRRWWSKRALVALNIGIGLWVISAEVDVQAQTQSIRSGAKVVGPRGRVMERERRLESQRSPYVPNRFGRVQQPARAVGRRVEVQRSPTGLERSVRVQGPGGATFERQLRVENAPGGIRREIQVQGPAGSSYQRRVESNRRNGQAGREIQIQGPAGASYHRQFELQRPRGGLIQPRQR